MSAVFTPTRYKLSVWDYHKLGEAGILAENSRVELIEGELIQMAPIGATHMALVNRLNKRLVVAVGDLGMVSIQNPIILPPHSEPQPDIVILKPIMDGTAPTVPCAADVMLLIEVADTTLAYDRKTKLAIYAKAAVTEAWIVNVQSKCIEVYREPSRNRYLQRKDFAQTDVVSPLALPQVQLTVGEIFR